MVRKTAMFSQYVYMVKKKGPLTKIIEREKTIQDIYSCSDVSKADV